jgi:hypothetical protein
LYALVILPAHAFEVRVVDPAGNAVSGFRWLVEEDATFAVVPGDTSGPMQALSMHRSYMPLRSKGHSDTDSATIDLPADQRYYVSVMPDSGFNLSGARVTPAQGVVTVSVTPQPVPTAQIAVFVFEDNFPINNAPDLPQEQGLGGFSLIIKDIAGQVTKDAFGNPLGTTYQQDAAGNFIEDLDGNPVPLQLGDGTIVTISAANVNDPAKNPFRLNVGEALIKYLPPGKYGVQAVPPPGSAWQQTATIEGTKTIDAWVKANEPPYFVEFGPAGHHVFVGFVQPFNAVPPVAPGGVAGSISGHIVNLHNSRPPVYTFYPGHPLPNCWIGLNELAGGNGRGLYAQRCNADSTFTIPDVPPGSYQLVAWDDYLDNIFAFHTVTVPASGGTVDLGAIPVFRWFGSHDHYVFDDTNQNGFRDPGELGIPEQAVNLRFRDGTIYQTFPTDTEGYVPFDEVFPFFNWLVAEVDFLRFKATGVTVVTDGGGEVRPDEGWAYPSRNKLTPQPQIAPDGTPIVNLNTGNNLSRTETGPVLTQAFQSFLGTTDMFEWGKKAYVAGENGGISGLVRYATTRAENDPSYAAGENWEPGIPRVQVNLYSDNGTGAIVDADGDGVIEIADVDNAPFGWADGGPMGAEDEKRNGPASGTNDPSLTFDAGDAIQIAYTDSWDDNVPTGCSGDIADPFFNNGSCYDGLRNFNQVRNGVFDGGYAFASYHAGGVASGSPETDGLPPGYYIVEAAAPPGYEHVKEEDKNVDFGQAYTPSLLALPPVCVGDAHIVPAELTLFPGVAAPYADTSRPLCDRKQITLTTGKNAAVDFALFTEVPVAGHVVGFVLNDLANEFDPAAPTFGEKYAPPFLPISIRDYTGREISRVYSDQWGVYNALVPSTYTMNRPAPSGISPSMMTFCLNSPGPIPDAANPGQFITDPYFNRQYSQFCYTFNFLPGTTTYLDTPVLPIAAFTGSDAYPVDCELPTGTPMIHSVSGPQGGPYVAAVGERITIASMGEVQVPNPAYDPALGTLKTIARDFGFGATPGNITIGGVPLTNVQWTAGAISGDVAPGTPTGQLLVMRGDNGSRTAVGVTVTVGNTGITSVVHVPVGGSIQTAVDAAPAGALILVPPGNYEEPLIMWKNVQLQGWGPGSTIINALKAPAEKMVAWRQKAQQLVAQQLIDLLPGQTNAPDFIEPGLFNTEEGAGILVLAKEGTFTAAAHARIDGFTVTGADHAGGIVVNGYAHYLQISNNRVVNNQGVYGGGIRLGHPFLIGADDNAVNALNDHIDVRFNQVIENGSLDSPGGGIALYNGSDAYRVTENFICGNFSQGDGGGVAHFGRSPDGLIARNIIAFNQGFEQTPASGGAGGGVLIAGLPGTAGALSAGAGSVSVIANLIQGNNAGSGDGGGVSARYINGQDVAAAPTDNGTWDALHLFNNAIVNNVTGLAGGGVALQDAAKVYIVNNTIANNDSTATAGAAFQGNPNLSAAQPAGVVSRAHSGSLAGLLPAPGYSDPVLVNNIIWHNRSFHWDVSVNDARGGLVPDIGAGAPPVYADLAVLGVAALLNPQSCVLSDATGYDASNAAADPLFVAGYVNGDRGATIVLPEVTTGLATATAFDEGGNYIDVHYGPLTLTGDYHLQQSSPAVDSGSDAYLPQFTALQADIEAEARPADGQGDGVATSDIGADEVPGSGLTITSVPVTVAIVGQGYSYQVVVTAPAGATLAYSLDVAPTGMTISMDGLVQWLPTAEQLGSHAVTVRVQDMGGVFALQSFSVQVSRANQMPVAVNDTVSVDTNGVFVLAAPGLLANDSDADGDTLTAIQVSDIEKKGTASVNADGSLTYTPEEFFVGTQTFSYKANDGQVDSNIATVTIVRELVVKEAVFKDKRGNKGQWWVVKGRAATPGSVLTVYVGATVGGSVIGTASVDTSGRWELRSPRSTIVPDASGAISVESSTGAQLLNVPVQMVIEQDAAIVALNQGLPTMTTPTKLPSALAVEQALFINQGGGKRDGWRVSGRSALPGSTVELYIGTLANGKRLGETRVASDGTWSFRQDAAAQPPAERASISVRSPEGTVENIPVVVRRR